MMPGLRASLAAPAVLVAIGATLPLAMAWQAAPVPSPLESSEARERLQALPYATWAPRDPATAGGGGVTRYRQGRTWDGLNLFPLTTRAESWLVDMKGQPVHVPSSGRIVWSQDGFFSDKQGGCQALPNGNVLVIESQTGRAFELTRAGETVWEFYNKEEEPGLRPTLRQMVRIGDEAGARLRRRLVP